METTPADPTPDAVPLGQPPRKDAFLMSQIRLVLAVHDHQPIGNFDTVFAESFENAYAPFLDVLGDFPSLSLVLHTSGSLIEWLVDHRPQYIDLIREFVDRGQIEILGGPFYEPILSGIPSRDRLGQIRLYTRYLEDLFEQKIRGMWLPERVWEQQFARDIAAAGIEYLILDDSHFRAAGLRGRDLRNYYLTEDDGRLLALFPGDEPLRYLIPFAKPEASINYLRKIADEHPGSVVTFGDDGEKFGAWPGTHERVFDEGWLREFFGQLVANDDWIQTTTLAEAFESVAPLGKLYVPDGSYREMTEWALPTERQLDLEELAEGQQTDPDWPRLKQYLRGGFWRNFRVKYPEVNEMYCRMLGISDRLEAMARGTEHVVDSRPLAEARTHLYQAQCNCAYWHGAFGGLYLPHLRGAIYSHLIEADTLLERAAGKTGRFGEVEARDFDLDGRTEVRLTTDRLIALLKPSRGGHLYELDIRGIRCNLLATLDRRPEPYHHAILDHLAMDVPRPPGEPPIPRRESERGGVVPNDEGGEAIVFKQPDLDQRIAYDAWPRKSLVDHFLMPGLSAEEFRAGEGELGDFPLGVYETTLKRADDRVEAVMSRTGYLTRFPIHVEKTVAVLPRSGGMLEATYQMRDLPPGRPIHFAVELNFAGMAAGQPDRYFYDAAGQALGELQELLELEETDRLGLVDEWLGLDAAVEISEPAGFWTWPVESINRSEGGFEAVHQSTVVVPHWEFIAPADGCWRVVISLTLDTSAAQAKKLEAIPALVGAG